MKFSVRTIRWKVMLAACVVWLAIFIAVFGLEAVRGISVPLILTAGLVGTWVANRGQTNQLAVPALVFWMALAGTSLNSIEPHRSMYWVALIGGGLLLVLLTAGLTRATQFSRYVTTGVLITSGVIGAIFALDFIQWYAEWLNAYPGEWLPWVSYRLGGGNNSGAWAAGCALLAAGLALKAKKVAVRVVLWLYAAVAVGLLFLSSSRGALVGVAAAGVIWAVLERDTWLRWLAPSIAFFRRRKALGIGLVAVAAVGLAGVGWLLLNVLAGHPSHGGAVLNSRSLFWSVGWQMFVESPLWGNGLYTYSAFFMKAVSVPPWDIFLHPHNMHLDVLSSSGLVGGAAYLFLIWAVWRALLRARQSAPVESQGIVLAAILMVTGYLGHGVFDVLYHMQPASINLALVLGVALSFDPPVERKAPRWSLAVLGIGVCALAWWTAIVRGPAIQAVDLAQGNNPGTEVNWKAAALKMDKAVELVPYSPLYQSEAGLLAAELAWQGETGALDKAVEYFEEAVRLDPNVAAHHLNLGALYQSQGRVSEALTEFEEASRLAPNWDLAAVQVGLTAEEMGNTDQALRAYWKALKLFPELVNDPFWQVSTTRQQAVQLLRVGAGTTAVVEPVSDETVIRQSLAGPILERALDAMEAGEISRAESLVSAAELAYRSTRLEGMELSWIKAELAYANGDTITASQLGAWAIAGLEEQGWQGPGAAGQALYDSGIYRMPDFKVELVPQVTFLRLFGAWSERMERLAEWQRQAGDSARSKETLALLASWQE